MERSDNSSDCEYEGGKGLTDVDKDADSDIDNLDF